MSKKIVGIIVLVFCFHSLIAQTFATRQLEYLSSLMLCSLPQQSGIFHCPEVCSLPLRVEYDKTGMVYHLGIYLFPDSLKKHSLTKPLFDFQERLFLEVFLQGSEEKARQLLGEYKVFWLDRSLVLGAGTFFSSLEESLRLASTKDIEIVMTKDSLRWTSLWNAKNSNFVLRFPANFDLINGCDKNESEQWIAKQLQSFKCESFSTSTMAANIEGFELSSKSLYVRLGQNLFIQNMNGNLYFEFRMVFDRKHPEESIANLFNNPDQQLTKDFDLQVRQVMYGAESQSYKIKLSDFQCFMGDDYNVFTGIEKCTSDAVEFSVIYKSKFYNIWHLLYVQTTPKALFTKSEALKATFYSFIPNQNIKNLYKDYIPHK
jgi:hypothetical protein